jgi:hypothetical protein
MWSSPKESEIIIQFIQFAAHREHFAQLPTEIRIEDLLYISVDDNLAEVLRSIFVGIESYRCDYSELNKATNSMYKWDATRNYFKFNLDGRGQDVNP